ncbi:MAG: hypothetical protein GPJ54_12880 [Candidatus Heimdallarchaeota archaeon]|nr:hypothetical protein [Candidatus Heimdallarchaeota archaeon]
MSKIIRKNNCIVNNSSCLGSDLEHLLSEISDNRHRWEIKRSERSNKFSSVANLIICGRITNSTIGAAISNNVNHIVSIDRFQSTEQQFIVDDIFELLYKNDIYVISLGVGWLFATSLGKKMINIVLNNTDSSIWSANIGVENIFIGLKINLKIDDIFSRLRNCVYYFPAKLGDKQISISSILVIESSFETLNLEELPDLILTMELTSSLITFCYHKKIILVFVHSDVLYFEIARDLSHLLMSALKVSTTLCDPLQYKVKIK